MPISPAEFSHLTGAAVDLPLLAYAGIRDDVLVGFGGLAWGMGRCWLFLYVLDRPNAVVLWRWAKRLLAKAAQLGETQVFTPRDRSFDTSERLLTRLGFIFHGVETDPHTQTEEEIWVWVSSR